MRPVERGAAPRIFAAYGDAIGDLEARLGNYCSYCERRFTISLAVEHIVPKSRQPQLETEWTNFLLGCLNCNSVKGKKLVKVENFLWCDRDNTFLAFTYSEGGFVRLADNLNVDQKAKAQALLDLIGLQRHQATGWKKPTRRDKRWKDREEVWTIAEKCRDIFIAQSENNQTKELVLQVAQGYGFFSVWMTVFDAYSNVKKELIQLFTGTATSCFDQNGKPIGRQNGII